MRIVEVAKEIKGNAIDLSEDTLDYNAALQAGCLLMAIASPRHKRYFTHRAGIYQKRIDSRPQNG